MKKGFKALTAFIKRKRKLISIIVTIVSIFVFLLWLNNNAKTTNSSQEPELSSFEILRESDPGLADIYEIVARQDVELVVIDELRNTIQVYPVPSEDDTIFTSERPIIFIYPDAVEDELFNRLVFESGVEQKLEFKEINQEDKLKTELEEEFGFEIILFYALIVFVILLGVYKIYKNRQSV